MLHALPAGYNSGDTIYCYFPSYDGNGASVTITGLAVTDIEIYKNGSTTQRSSDNGYTLLDTDGIDFDSSTGLQGFKVDTSDNSDAGFWADGAHYLIWVDAITISGQTVRLGYECRLGVLLRPTTDGRRLDVSSGGEAGLDWANIGSPTTTVDLSGTTINVLQKVDLNTIKTQAVVCAAGTTFGAYTGNATAPIAVDGSGHITVGTVAAGAIDASAIADGAIDTATFAAGTTIPRVTLADTLTTYTGNTPQTGDAFARIGAAGVGLSNIGDTRMANLDAAVSSRMATYTQPTGFLTASFPTDPADQSLIIAATDAITAAIAALNNLSSAQAQTAAAAALTAWGKTGFTLGTDGLPAAAVASAAANKIADHVKRRTQANTEASSDGDTLDLSSEYGLIQQAQESAVSGGTLTVYMTDGTTPLGTKAVASNAAADPVTGIS